jgi:hypothetical protein
VWVLMSVVLLAFNIRLSLSLTIQFEHQQFTAVAQHSHVETAKADTGIRRLNGLETATGS